jgi:uncharacterized protein
MNGTVYLVFALAGVQPQAPAITPASPPIVEATGRGELRLPPDVAVLKIGISARASTANAAAMEAGRRLEAVADTLRRLGLAPEVTRAVALRVGGNESYTEKRVVDYEAQAGLLIRVRDLARLGVLVDGALAAGATDIPSVRFESDSMEAAAREALTRAYASAEGKARAMARAAGLILGPIVQMIADQGYFGVDDDYAFEGLMMKQQATVTPRRDVAVTAGITVRWKLLRRH